MDLHVSLPSVWYVKLAWRVVSHCVGGVYEMENIQRRGFDSGFGWFTCRCVPRLTLNPRASFKVWEQWKSMFQKEPWIHRNLWTQKLNPGPGVMSCGCWLRSVMIRCVYFTHRMFKGISGCEDFSYTRCHNNHWNQCCLTGASSGFTTPRIY